MRKYFQKIIPILFITIGSTMAQEKGNIRGAIVDEVTKQPLIGANVQVFGTNRGSTTNVDGVFEINDLPENVYKLKISYIGYLSYLETDVRVIRRKTTSVKEIGLELTTLQGAEIVITPGLQAEIESMPVSSRSYSREEIRRTAGAIGDVIRATSTLPGVSTTAGEFTTFSVRGSNSHDNLILIDNIPFEKISHFEGGSAEQEVQGSRFSIFTGGLVEDVTFSAGGFGANYGRKNASVIDLTMKEGNFETPTVYASFDPGGGELNFDGPLMISENTSLVLNARYYDYTKIVEAMNQAHWGNPAFGDAIFKTTTVINPKHRVSLLGIYSLDNFNRDRKNVFAADDLVQNDVWDIEETRQLLGLNWRWLTGKHSFLRNTVFYRGNVRDRSAGNAWGNSGITMPESQDDIKIRRDIITQKQNENEFGWKADYTHMFSERTVNAGIEVFSIDLDYLTRQNGNDTLYTFDSHDYRPDPMLNYIVTTPEMIDNHFNNNALQFGAYVGQTCNSFSNLTIAPGLRFEINSFNKQRTFSPRLQVKYLIDARTAINTAVGLYFQNPIYSDLTSAPENIYLKNERALHAILGFTRQIGDDYKLTVEGYYKKLDNLVVPINYSSMELKNKGEGWASGLDFLLQKRYAKSFYAQMGYSFSVSKRNDNNGLGEYNAPYNQPHIFNLLGGYQINKRFFVSAKFHAASGLPKHNFIVHENIFNDSNFIRYSQEITDRYADRMTPYIMLDARVDYHQQFGRLALVTYVDLSNVLNRYNSTEDRFSELSGEEKALGFGFLPTFGFKLEF
ncbi:MAG: TonB-dependent receptor [Deferribacteres bacterium]|nr:TonB-dependent receptor [candidate division KSB1 bacterium]MCB9500677.1 TonB-dependent receptor [Deferribacteres bacterium]